MAQTKVACRFPVPVPSNTSELHTAKIFREPREGAEKKYILIATITEIHLIDHMT